MTRTLLTAGAMAALFPAAAVAAFAVGDQLGTSEEELRAKFEAQGYTVTEIETEDGEIEVEYLDNGQEFELSIAVDTGLVTEIEAEDDDD